MTTFVIFAFIALVLAAVMEEVESDCCRQKTKGYCADCTKGTPYCSYGKCNIFGCKCERSCRKDCGPVIERTSTGWLFTHRIALSCTCTNGKRAAKDVMFDDTDANEDGKINPQDFDPDQQWI